MGKQDIVRRESSNMIWEEVQQYIIAYWTLVNLNEQTWSVVIFQSYCACTASCRFWLEIYYWNSFL